MARILFLSHRLPYPPDKGDKIRSFHVLQHLARQHEVLLGTFIDDPLDAAHLPAVRAMCAELHVSAVSPARGFLRSLVGLVTGEPLTVRYYHDAPLRAWLGGLRRRGDIDLVYVYSAAMTPYASAFKRPTVVDFADVDSAKWGRFAERSRGLRRWAYARESRLLRGVERDAAARAQSSLFVTEREAEAFRRIAPESAARVGVLGNGVDGDYFRPDPARPSPFAAGELALVFTGKMDYWPNVDAVTWFAADVLPRLRARWPNLRLHVVGRNPSAAVRALQGDAVHVTGTVADVRPYLQHAAVAVVPMRIANGVQNKILEAMAMGRAAVVSTACAPAIDASPGRDFVTASSADDYVREIDALLRDADRRAGIGRAAAVAMRDNCSWPSRLEALDAHVADALADERMAALRGPAARGRLSMSGGGLG